MSFQEIDRNSILEDEHQQRIRRIKLIERETKEQAPIWQAKQATLFPTALPLSQTPSLGQIITEEIQNNAYDADVLYQRAEQKIKSIADNTNTQYILDRLDDQQLYYLVNSWDGIVKNLKEKYTTSGLDKNIFVQMIQDDAQNLKQTPVIAMASRGDLRTQQKLDLEKEKQAKVDAERTQLENEKQAFDAEVNQRQQDKEAEELKQDQEQQKRQALLKKLKKNRILASLKNSANKLPPMQSNQPPSQPTPQPQSKQQVILPTISSNTTTFVFDPTKDTLFKKWEDEFNVKFDSIKQIINQLDPDDISDSLVDLEIKYPDKMIEMPFASEKNILIDFYMRELLDEAYKKQLAQDASLAKFNKSVENSPYENDKKAFQK